VLDVRYYDYDSYFNNSSFNVPRLAARRRTGMTREGQRICRLMCYLTLITMTMRLRGILDVRYYDYDYDYDYYYEATRDFGCTLLLL
jgi:hypothetical protein